MMLSKTQSKYIRSLAILKFRQEYKNFLAEGEKIVGEWLLSTAKIEIIAGTEAWISENEPLVLKHPEAKLIQVSELELKQISNLQSPNKVLIVVQQRPAQDLKLIDDWCLALDGIRDPGNMGTILRIADWFGIQHLVCTPDCVDYYSPKVVQAAMGAHLRVQLYESELSKLIPHKSLPAFAAVLGGENVYQVATPEKGILVIGNEAMGVSKEVVDLCEHKITIPRIGGAESLNAAVSTGILCALLRK